MRLIRSILMTCLPLVICPLPVRAQSCELALALVVDVSGSVDRYEYRIQMDGLAAALRDGIVSDALVRGQARLMLVQWTGNSRQRVTIPWVPIRSFDDLEAFAGQVATDPRQWRNYSTAIGEALEYTLRQFDQVAGCKRLVIDVSSDGVSNEGIEPQFIQPLLRARNVTVNAVVIDSNDDGLADYFRNNVITGAGAFVVTANGFDDYPEHIRKKLIRETGKKIARVGLP